MKSTEFGFRQPELGENTSENFAQSIFEKIQSKNLITNLVLAKVSNEIYTLALSNLSQADVRNDLKESDVINQAITAVKEELGDGISEEELNRQVAETKQVLEEVCPGFDL